LSRTDWPELEHRLFLSTFKRFPVTLVRGRGTQVWDDQNREYLDLVGGWAANSLGHCPPVVVQALETQARKLIHTSNQFYTVPQIDLAQLLVDNSSLHKVFLCNSGAEANEGAVKLARRYGRLHLDGAHEIITADGSFHGRTLAMTAATGQHKFQEAYAPLPAGFVQVPFNDVEAIRQTTRAQTCAVMLEPIQGEGGVNIPSTDYLEKVQDWCRQNGILLILDEIQTGVGRTGTLFAYQQHNVEPDIITLAKGLASGVPIGAFLAKEHAAVFSPGDHGSTFGGNPLACAAAYATVKYIIDQNIPAKVRETGKYFMGSLEELRQRFEFVSEVRGQGLLIAMEFHTEMAHELAMACLNKRLLVNAVRPNALRFMPPLTITEQEVDQAIVILEDVLAEKARR